MGDTLTHQERSERMSRVRSKDTKPELVVRRLVHGLGYHHRLHCVDVPGYRGLVSGARNKFVISAD